jgi:putative transposon-encoded protein
VAYGAIRRKEERALARLRQEGNAAEDGLLVNQDNFLLASLPDIGYVNGGYSWGKSGGLTRFPEPCRESKQWLLPSRRGTLSVDRSEIEKKDKRALLEMTRGKVKFEAFGEEMLEKKVSLSGNSGRIYLPPDWVGHHVKIIRID